MHIRSLNKLLHRS